MHADYNVVACIMIASPVKIIQIFQNYKDTNALVGNSITPSTCVFKNI